MKICVAADPFAYSLKKSLVAHLEKEGHSVIDVDRYAKRPYYEVAVLAAEKIQRREADCGILFCGTGAGMCIVANKFAGIRAVAVESVFTAARAKAINDANVIAMGAMVTGPEMAAEMADAWLSTKFTEGLEELASFLTDAKEAVDGIDRSNRKQ